MPKTEDEKNKFDSYISQKENNSVEKFSASDIKMIAVAVIKKLYCSDA
ncbi:hypothetical protein [Metabacillus fastidiosus]